VPTYWCAGDFDYPSPPDAPLVWLGVDETAAAATLEALVDDARAAGLAIRGHGFASGNLQAACLRDAYVVLVRGTTGRRAIEFWSWIDRRQPKVAFHGLFRADTD
jgi:hypothetical protein